MMGGAGHRAEPGFRVVEDGHPLSMTVNRERVPVRSIAATIGMVLATLLVLLLLRALARIVIWTVIAAFFAVALYPAVNRLERRVGGRRWLATLLVFVAAVIVVVGLVTLFVVPLVREGTDIAHNLPDYVRQARTGTGPLGELLHRYNVDDYVARNQDRIRQGLTGFGTPALHVLRTAAETIAGILTIIVLSYLMVLEGPLMVTGTLALLPERHRDRVRRVSADCARTVNGYLTGNLLISLICGLLTFVVLVAVRVPYAGLIALFVALTDLIPLIGATLGAVIAVSAGLYHSLTAGIITLVFFVVYQQAENHLLQPIIMSRTVKLNPLTVFLAILIGVELFGLLGALLAIPVAGIVQIIVRDLYDVRRGRMKPEPTVGPDEVPVATRNSDGTGEQRGDDSTPTATQRRPPDERDTDTGDAGDRDAKDPASASS